MSRESGTGPVPSQLGTSEEGQETGRTTRNRHSCQGAAASATRRSLQAKSRRRVHELQQLL